jgi:hypothetical protein
MASGSDVGWNRGGAAVLFFSHAVSDVGTKALQDPEFSETGSVPKRSRVDIHMSLSW